MGFIFSTAAMISLDAFKRWSLSGSVLDQAHPRVVLAFSFVSSAYGGPGFIIGVVLCAKFCESRIIPFEQYCEKWKVGTREAFLDFCMLITELMFT